jgi:hypothetical protein
MFCPETPEVLFQDYGTGQLVDGSAHINIDPIFTKNITVDENHPLKVFIQLEGDCSGVFVANKSATGFDVIELNGGSSNVPFSWSIVANRSDKAFIRSDGSTKISHYSDARFPQTNAGTVEIKDPKENKEMKRNPPKDQKYILPNKNVQTLKRNK